MFEGMLGAQPCERAATARVNFALILVGALAWLSTGQAQAQSSPTIEWEVYNRFRFYKDPEIFRKYLAVAEDAKSAGPANWALATENALQKKAENERLGWAAIDFKPQSFCWRSGSWQYNNCGSERDYVLPKTITILAKVAGDTSRESGTCSWALETPEGAKAAISGPCAGAKIDVPYAGDATKESKLCIAVRPNATDCVANIAPAEVTIRDYLIVGMGDSFGAGVGNPDIPAQIQSDGRNAFFYYTIYGFPSDHSPIDDPPRYYVPAREGLGARGGGPGQAQWLDIRCFRSQYGPQFRAALQLAVALKHNSVTYVDLACNGATVLQGLLSPKPLDPGFAANLAPVPPQLEDAARIVCDRRTAPWSATVVSLPEFHPSACGEGKLCEYKSDKTLDFALLQRASRLNLNRNRNQAPSQKITLQGCGQDGYRRPIDYLLLSIGGNDIGFASLVAQEALPTETLDAQVLRQLLQYTFGLIEDGAGAEVRLGFLPHIYARLNEAFAKLMPIRGQDPSRILLAAYPLPDGGSGSTLCGETAASAGRADETMDGLNVLGGFPNGDAPDGAKVKIVKEVHEAACKLDVQRTAWMDEAAEGSGSMAGACPGISPGAEPASKLPWRYVTGLVQTAWPHGYCAAARNLGSACNADPNGALCVAETAKLPAFHDAPSLWLPLPRPNKLTSIPYDVANYRAYQSRERWFRTFNDAYLTTNWQATLADRSDIANALSTFSTSAMHPTAEGYAAIADALVQAIGADLCKRGEVDGAGKEIVNFCPQ
jgi:lysophospholipase L1-like esterase